jgi:lipopolysaccharide assembly protein A
MTIVRWVVGLTVFLALLFLSLQNAELVTVRFYHWFSWEAPLIFLLLIAFALGVGAGLLAGLMRYVRVKRQLSRLRREQRRGPAATAEAPVDGG